MKRPPPPLSYVRSFEAAARHLSFTRAAAELGFTQAAISTHVRALEHYVGRALFVRNPRSLTLTEAGEAYLPTLRQALGQIDSATDAIAKSARDQSVAISCPTSLAQIWLPQVLQRFRQQRPDVEVLVHATVWERDQEEIADLAISIHREDEVPPGYTRLWPEHLMLVCAPALARGIHRASALAGHPQILVSGRQEYSTVMARALGLQTGLQPDAPVTRTNASNVALELAAAGLGVTVTLASLGGAYVARGLVVEPLGIRAPSPWAYYLRPTNPRQSAAAQTLLDALHGCAAEVRSGG